MGRGGGVGACLFGEVGPSVVMPNHAHDIIVLHATVGASLVGAQSGNHRATTTRATTRVAPTFRATSASQPAAGKRHRATTSRSAVVDLKRALL